MCAGGEGPGPCFGRLWADAGGPLVCEDALVGVVSFLIHLVTLVTLLALLTLSRTLLASTFLALFFNLFDNIRNIHVVRIRVPFNSNGARTF